MMLAALPLLLTNHCALSCSAGRYQRDWLAALPGVETVGSGLRLLLSRKYRINREIRQSLEPQKDLRSGQQK